VASTSYDSMTGGSLSRLVFQAAAGETVRIRVAAEVPFPALANGRLYTGAIRTPVPPVNDSCEASSPIPFGGTVAFSLTNSTKTAPPCYASENCFQANPDPCTIAINDDVYFSFVAPNNGTADIRVSDGEPYPYAGAVIAVLDSCSTSTPPAFCGSACGDAPADSLRFAMVAGQRYIIRLGTYVSSATAGGMLTVTCPADFNGAGGVSVQDIFDFLAAYFTGFPSGDFNGSGTTCNAAGNNTMPCCKADYNQSGSVTVQDIFDFLSGYFTSSPLADVNASGSVTVQDIFDFLGAYFTGC
jgi:hypothetical protein